MAVVKTYEELDNGDPLNLSPHSVESEECVLGSILMNPDAFWDVQPHLTADDFFILRHGWIYEAIEHIAGSKDMAMDTRTVAEVLRKRGQLDDIGGEAYLHYLPNTMPTALHAEAYAMLVERAALRRRLLGAVGEIAQLAHDEEKDTPDVLNKSQRLIMDVAFRKSSTGARSVAEIGRGLYDKLGAARLNNTEVIGVPTGFVALDNEIGGLQKKTLMIIASRPGMGKSSLCLQIASNAADHEDEYHAMLFSGEMDDEAILQRLFAQRYGVPMDQQRRMNDHQWEQFHECQAWWEKLPVFVDDSSGLTPMAIARECREHKRTHGRLDLVIVDYLQRFKADGFYQKKNEEVGAIAFELKELSREFEIPVIAAAQLSRACEARNDKRPMLSDLAESGKIEQEADIILFPFREGYYTGERYNPQPADNIVDLDIAKHRNGNTPTLPMLWDGPTTTFRDADNTHIDLRGL